MSEKIKSIFSGFFLGFAAYLLFFRPDLMAPADDGQTDWEKVGAYLSRSMARYDRKLQPA